MTVDVRKLTVLGVLLMGALLPVKPAAGAPTITVTGDVAPPYNGSKPWNITGDLTLGSAGEASMALLDGGIVTNANAFMAILAGSKATVNISASEWHSTGNLYIGGSQTQAGGTAALDITSGVVEANDIVIWHGGTVGGYGTLKAPMVTNWGTIKQTGAPLGTLTVQGDMRFEPNSVLEVRVNNSGASDKLSITGQVTIAGGTVKAISTETITGTKQYTIVDANKVTGAFDALDTALLDVNLIDPYESLGYGSKSVLLRIAAYRFDKGVAQTPNQQELGKALQRIAVAGGTAVTGALQQLPTLNDVRAAYDQLSGQSRPPLAPILATDTAKFMGIVSDRLQGARGAVARDVDSLSDSPLLAMAEPLSGIGSPSSRNWDSFMWDLGQDRGNQSWGTWGKVYGLLGDRKTKNGVTGYSYNVLGESVGLEVQLSERFLGGATAGYSSGQVDYDTLTDTADISTMHAGLYSTYAGDGWYASSMVTHSWIDLQTERVVDLTREHHEGDFGASEWSGYIEAGLDWQPAPSWLIQPLAAFQVTFLSIGQCVETGGPSALIFDKQEYDSYRASVGAKVTKELPLGSQGLAALVQARGRWVHEFGDVVSSVNTRFVDVPTISFAISDEAVSRESFVVGAGAGVRLTRGLRAFVDYDMSFNTDKTVQVISGALDYRW
jgi:subtilase-type serine protease